MDTLWQDLRYAARTLWGRLGVTLAAVLALGLGIGANTAVFTLVNAVLLRPLPVPDPGRLVMVYRVEKEMKFGAASVPRYLDWRDRNEVFEGLGAYAPANFTLTGSGEPVQISGATGTATLFRVLGRHRAWDAGSATRRIGRVGRRRSSSATRSGAIALGRIPPSSAAPSRSMAGPHGGRRRRCGLHHPARSDLDPARPHGG